LIHIYTALCYGCCLHLNNLPISWHDGWSLPNWLNLETSTNWNTLVIHLCFILMDFDLQDATTLLADTWFTWRVKYYYCLGSIWLAWNLFSGPQVVPGVGYVLLAAYGDD
jgi:hypothetical protein